MKQIKSSLTILSLVLMTFCAVYGQRRIERVITPDKDTIFIMNMEYSRHIFSKLDSLDDAKLTIANQKNKLLQYKSFADSAIANLEIKNKIIAGQLEMLAAAEQKQAKLKEEILSFEREKELYKTRNIELDNIVSKRERTNAKLKTGTYILSGVSAAAILTSIIAILAK